VKNDMTTTQELAARVDLLSIVVQELAQALAPAQKAQVAEAVRRRVADLAPQHLSEAADEALAADLALLLAALGQ
jgi:hypothetical protein